MHIRWTGHVGHMEESRDACRILERRPEGKRLLGRPSRTWQYNIELDLKEVCYDEMNLKDLAQDRDP